MMRMSNEKQMGLRLSDQSVLYFTQAIDILEGLLPDPVDKVQLPPAHLQRLFIFSIMWSMGALLELQDRSKLEEFLLKHESKFNYPKLNENETIFEYMVGDNGAFLQEDT